MGSILGTKGQVVIEKRLRDALGLEPGWVSSQRLVDDHLEIRFHPPEHDRSLRGVLSSSIRRPVAPERWQELRDEAWAQTVAEEWSNEEQEG
ncbi:MAG: AbrB family transcriptional regulator [Acidobacteria bacterium]|nr:AbrB family transcriptional regulator [Acidobacteriota bacterium]